MTTAALVSIYSDHAERIYSGEKRFEFRTKKPARKVDYLALYETSPMQSVTGFARISSILEGSPREVWEKTREGAGISYEYFMGYFEEKKKAIAYCLDSPCRFRSGLSLKEIGVSGPPQSFQYLSDEALKKIFSTAVHDSDRRLFIGGVHGAGKTALAEWLAEKFGSEAFSSSALISSCRREGRRSLGASQDDLIDALRTTSWFTHGGILDGHFVLRSPEGEFFFVPEDVFSEMKLTSILLLKASPTLIAERLIARDAIEGVEYQNFVDSIADLQTAEYERAKQVATAIGVPMETIENRF